MEKREINQQDVKFLGQCIAEEEGIIEQLRKVTKENLEKDDGVRREHIFLHMFWNTEGKIVDIVSHKVLTRDVHEITTAYD